MCSYIIVEETKNEAHQTGFYKTNFKDKNFLVNTKENITDSYQFSTLCVDACSMVFPSNFTKLKGLFALLVTSLM